MAAGSAILQVYQSGCFDVENKADNSPLTRADRASHEIIEANLIASGHPILSEEGRNIAYNERKNWRRFWLVDPLDGTKEFIHQAKWRIHGQYCVEVLELSKFFMLRALKLHLWKLFVMPQHVFLGFRMTKINVPTLLLAPVLISLRNLSPLWQKR